MVSVYERELRKVTPAERTKRRLLIWAGVLLVVLAFVFVYSGTAWIWFRPVLHKPIINKYAGEYKCDPLWVMAIIKVESGFLPRAQSPRGAVGLMQLLPSTARDIAPEIGLQIQNDDDLKNPDINYPETRRFVQNVERTYGYLKMVQGWKYLFGIAHGR